MHSGLQEPTSGQKAGYNLDKLPFYHRPNIDRPTNTLTFTPTDNLGSPIPPKLHVFSLWEEAGATEENPWGEHAGLGRR